MVLRLQAEALVFFMIHFCTVKSYRINTVIKGRDTDEEKYV